MYSINIEGSEGGDTTGAQSSGPDSEHRNQETPESSEVELSLKK